MNRSNVESSPLAELSLLTSETSAVDTSNSSSPAINKKSTLDILRKNKCYSEVAALLNEDEVDAYIRENNQCSFTRVQRNHVKCTQNTCIKPEEHRMIAVYLKCTCGQEEADCNLR